MTAVIFAWTMLPYHYCSPLVCSKTPVWRSFRSGELPSHILWLTCPSLNSDYITINSSTKVWVIFTSHWMSKAERKDDYILYILLLNIIEIVSLIWMRTYVYSSQWFRPFCGRFTQYAAQMIMAELLGKLSLRMSGTQKALSYTKALTFSLVFFSNMSKWI